MSSRHLVDPELLPLLEQMPGLQLSPERLPEIRAASASLVAQERASRPPNPDVQVSEERAPGPDGAPGVRLVAYRPLRVATPMPALLWIHGGGYVMGAADGDDLQATRIATQAGCLVVSVDYRLAPEAPFPAGVEDCYAALRWLHGQAERLGVDRARIAIGGASAGGGLAAALALLARDRGDLPVAFQLLLVPMLDDRTVAAADPHPYVGEFTWTPVSNLFGWSALLGHEPGQGDVSPYAAPARATDLAGLPSAYVCTGALDLFLEEDMDYARRLTRAGVPVELHVYPGAYHGFGRVATAQVTQRYVRDYLDALQRAFQAAPTTAAQPVAAAT